MNNILVIDGNSILNRAFYGIRPLSNKDGLPTNAIYGMVNILLKHLDAVKPTYAVVAYDLKAPTFRHKMYDAYKAGRHAMPEELALQLPYSKLLCKLLGLNVIELEGYEADDIIGTIATFATNNSSLHSYVLTGDRDSLQLINENITVLLAGNKDTVNFDTAAFIEKYGVTPDTFVDVKALMGDSSDNIPGVAGIGEKTALKLISDFNSLDAIYDNINDDKIAKGVRQKLIDNKENAYLSQKLAQIELNVPINKSLDDIRYKGINKSELLKLFTELEFGALIKRLELTDAEESTSDVVAAGNNAKYTEITSDKIKEIFEGNDVIAVSWSPESKEVLFATEESENFVCSLDSNALEDLIKIHSEKIVLYDSKLYFNRLNIDPLTAFKFDVKLAGYVADSTVGKYELDRLALKYLSESAISENDAALILRLYKKLNEELTRTNALSVLLNIEQPLAGILSDIEKEGFKIDTEGLTAFGIALGIAADGLTQSIYQSAGVEFNINSPKQLGEVLFEKLALPFAKKTKTGYSTSADILEKLAPYYPIVKDILEYRQIVKLKSTYTDALVAVADEKSLVHTSFNQTVTATGRLSSTEPNLQNIPIRTELGHELRKYFIPKKDSHLFIDADYSQIELRLLAHISDDKNMIDAFLSGTDIHTATAAQVFGVDVENVTPELRKRAKAVNFGIVYGIGDFSLSQDLGVTKKEAAEYIDGYKRNYPNIDKYLKDIVSKAYEDGFVTTEFGRRRYIPELTASKAMLKKFGERVAMNSPIQGTAADIIKIAMINTYKRLRQENIDAKLILQVHDELLVEADESCAEKAKIILKEEMENAANFKVPLTSDVSCGKTWYECK